MKIFFLPIITLVAFCFLLIYVVETANRTSSDVSITRIIEDTKKASKEISAPHIDEAILRTTTRILIASTIAVIAGGLYGLLLFTSKGVRLSFSCVNIFVRAVPITFIFGPLSLVSNPFDFAVPAYLASIPCAFIIADAMSSQSTSISVSRAATMRGLFKGNQISLLIHFYAWEVLTGLLTGIRIAVPYAGILVGVLEYIGAGNYSPGFGSIINNMTMAGESDAQMVGVVFSYGIAMALILSMFYFFIDSFISNRLQR